MSDKIIENNQVTIMGEVVSAFTFSHEVFGEGFYMVDVSVKRLSNSEDRIPVMISERLIDVSQDYTGEFVIEVSNHVPVKGLIYSSNPYMECLTPEFEGEEVRIGFQFHSEGFRVGDIQKGEFCIICNQLEYLSLIHI